MTEETKPFILEQLEEALEERQNPDRRKKDLGPKDDVQRDRRQGDRRDLRSSSSKS